MACEILADDFRNDLVFFQLIQCRDFSFAIEVLRAGVDEDFRCTFGKNPHEIEARVSDRGNLEFCPAAERSRKLDKARLSPLVEMPFYRPLLCEVVDEADFCWITLHDFLSIFAIFGVRAAVKNHGLEQ